MKITTETFTINKTVHIKPIKMFIYLLVSFLVFVIITAIEFFFMNSDIFRGMVIFYDSQVVLFQYQLWIKMLGSIFLSLPNLFAYGGFTVLVTLLLKKFNKVRVAKHKLAWLIILVLYVLLAFYIIGIFQNLIFEVVKLDNSIGVYGELNFHIIPFSIYYLIYCYIVYKTALHIKIR